MNASVKKRSPAEVDNSVSINPSPLSTSFRTPHSQRVTKKGVHFYSLFSLCLLRENTFHFQIDWENTEGDSADENSYPSQRATSKHIMWWFINFPSDQMRYT